MAGAISKNSECRAALENLRLQQKLPRSGRLLGVSKSNDFGTHVQEYPCVLVITPRSFRIVDALTGDTISKFFIKQVSFQAITPFKSKPEIFAVITENPNQSPTCHLFEVDQGVGKVSGPLCGRSLLVELTVYSVAICDCRSWQKHSKVS